MPLKQFLAAFLATQLLFPACVAAQDPVTAPPKAAMVPDSLKILILEGQGAINSTDQQKATAPVVEVRDQDDRPVEAATVVFRLPPSGPGGYFPGQQLSMTAVTNVNGQALAGRLIPNQTLGRFSIHITATAGNRMGETELTQTNTASEFGRAVEKSKGKSHRKRWVLIGAGAAAAIVAVLVIRSRSSSSSASSTTPTITIIPGAVTIGGR